MSRPQKLRTVCCDREFLFVPFPEEAVETVQLTLEEYETIRLIDYANLTQQECASMMEIARTTVQSIYEKARFKLADALIHQKNISIKGGHYKLCDHPGDEKNCLKENCKRKIRNREENYEKV